MPRSSVNDVIREMMAALAKWYGDTSGSLVTAGTGDAYTLATNSAHAALADLSPLFFRADRANTGAATLAVDGLAAKAIRKAGGSALVANDLRADRIYAVAYNATQDQFDLVTPAAGQRVIGEVIDYAGATAPAGWTVCDGGPVSRTTFAALFAVIGTTYGAGDGSTTFNLPDLRGRVVAGLDDMGGTSAGRLTSFSGALGGAGGSQTHTLTTGELPAHAHNYKFDGGNIRILLDAPGTANLVAGNTSVVNASATQLTGSGNAHNNVQPTMFLNKIIYTGV